MPLITIQKQFRQGIVLGYNFGRRSVKEKARLESTFSNQLSVDLGEARLFKGRHLGFSVISQELYEEYHEIRLSLGNIGLKGAMKEVAPLHITCGTLDASIKRSEIKRSLNALNEVLGDSTEPPHLLSQFVIPQTVMLDPVEFYPDEY